MSLVEREKKIRASAFHPTGCFVEMPVRELDQSVVKRFETQVRLHGDRVAIKTSEQEFTYDELNNISNGVARAVRKRTTRGPVVILMEPGAMAVGSMLGVLKTGLAFVHIDPMFPQASSRERLAELGSTLVLSTEESLQLRSTAGPTGCAVLQLGNLDLNRPFDNPERLIDPGSLAQILNTSGSTGAAKAVCKDHRSVLAGVRQLNNSYHLCCDDRLLLLATGTGQANSVIFSALLVGATLLPFNIRRQGMKELASWMLDEGVTIYRSSATLFRQFAGMLTGKEMFPSVRLVRLASETVYKSDVDLWRQHFSDHCVLVNGLSTAETGTIVEFFMNKQTVLESETVPVGYSTGSVQSIIVDDRGNELPRGETGELVVLSPYLAMGYLNRSDLTAERFRNVDLKRNLRMYMTGDLGRMSAEGFLEHLGRKNFRVKVRGYTVQLAEVEKILMTLEEIEAAVVEFVDHHGHGRLIAYLVPKAGCRPSVSSLRDSLSEQLPDFMLPSVFMLIEKMPVNSSGKIDRQALPYPGAVRPEIKMPYSAPQTATQQALVNLWMDVLNIDRVGIDDPFLELGGDSLLALLLAMRIDEQFDVQLPQWQLYECATPAEMSLLINRHQMETKGKQNASVIKNKTKAGQAYRLSPAQRRLWILNKLETGSTACNIPILYYLNGPLDFDVLQRSIESLAERHWILKMRVVVVDGIPMQQVMGSLKLPLQTIDLTHQHEAGDDPDALVSPYFEKFAREPFDLEKGSLIRAFLFKLDPSTHALLMVAHNMVADGWSARIMVRELAALYQGILEEKNPALPELPIQYPDYAEWLADELSMDRDRADLDYWIKRLEGVPPLELPTQYRRGPEQSFFVGFVSRRLSADLLENVRSLGKRENTTTFTVLLAAVKLLLVRYTGQFDISVGLALAGRARKELENLIGFFINTIVLRSDLSGESTFLQFLSTLHRTVVDGFKYQDLPFERIVELLNPPRLMNRHPVYQVLLSQYMPNEDIRFADVNAVRAPRRRFASQVDLEICIEDSRRDLEIDFIYNTSLFDEDFIERMADNFVTLLSEVSSNPGLSLSQYRGLSHHERQLQLQTWNKSRVGVRREPCLLDLIERQVEKTPDALALVVAGQELSYRDLNDRANRTAHGLRNHYNARPGVLVGVCMERSVEMMIALLGILKTGAAFVPFDPHSPGQRLEFMLQDSQPAVIVTRYRFLAVLGDYSVDAICLDSDRHQMAKESTANPGVEIADSDLAYVMYTSGSTGQPKGTLISHGAVANLLNWMRDELPLTPGDRVLQSTHFCFDVSIWEFFAPLQVGAQLVLYPDKDVADVRALIRTIVLNGVTVIQLVPSMLRMLLQEPGVNTCRSLRRIHCAGEVLTSDLCRRLFECLDIELYNLYGPTEATIYASYWKCNQRRLSPVLIGRPIANTQIYLLNDHLQLLPSGVPGEMYISGAGLARGYLNRPDLTAERFIPNPFSANPADRMYRTGDVGRYLADGSIEFLGRSDGQVKIRGIRIELEEIESVIGRHPAIRQAAVSVFEPVEWDKRLVAYIVAQADTVPGEMALKTYLRQALPEYMIPAKLIQLLALPRTPAGKLDRRQLPHPDPDRLVSEKRRAKTLTEKQIAGIWADILGIHAIGVQDNFFDLGGHSLSAFQVTTRILDELQLDIPIRAIFDTPTLVGLSEYVDHHIRRQEIDRDMETLTID